MNKIISENINLILKNKNLSQQELANRSGISRQSINLILSFNKTSNPKVSSLITIAHALDTDFPQLFSRNIDLDKPFNKIMTPEKYNNILIQNLKNELSGRNQKSISIDPGVSESTISDLLNKNKKDIRLSTLELIAEQIDKSISQLFKRGN